MSLQPDVTLAERVFQCIACETAYSSFESAKNCKCVSKVKTLKKCPKCGSWWAQHISRCCGEVLK